MFREVVRIPVGMAPKRLLVVKVPEGMGGPAEPGWLTAAQRPSTTDYYIKGGGILGFETTSLKNKFAAGEMTIESALVIGRKLGLRGITIDASHISAWDNTSLNRIKEAIEREGRILTGLLLNGNVVSGDEAGNHQQIEKYEQQIQAAGRLGAPLVRIALGSTGQGDVADQGVGVERAIAALKQLLPAAREHGVRIAIENQPGPAATVDGMLRIIQGTSPEWVRACIDFGSWQSNANLATDLEKLAPYTSHVQIKTHAFDEWGEEINISYDDVLVALEQSGYGEALSVEFDGDGDPVMGLIKSRDLMIKHWTGTAKTD
jgi:sugar phosphate isomerase/epimerase